MHVVVTQEHLDRGLPFIRNGSRCPIALAIRDAGLFEGVDFSVAITSVWDKAARNIAPHEGELAILPRIAQEFILDAFHRPEEQKPFEFDLKLVQ